MQHYEELMICGICKMKTDIKIDAELIGVQNALNFFSSLMKKICYSLKFKLLSLKIFFAFTNKQSNRRLLERDFENGK